MPSLLELQRRFADALRGDAAAPRGVQVYRNTQRGSYRGALAATYPVVRALVGAPFFDEAVDAYVHARPSTCGDLNVYGASFGEFLAGYPHAAHLVYLHDVARLEWAIDEASRAADVDAAPKAVLVRLSQANAQQALALHPSVRLLESRHPIWRIWQVHQPQHTGDASVRFTGSAEHVLVHREPNAIAVEQVPASEACFLQACIDGEALGAALAAALDIDAAFELGACLRRRVDDGTIVGVEA
ncbi:MAG TPA: DNA-binding domain-containing protein [Casimicrobiaceae bacterium]|jgi:hypothetical protein